MPHLPQAPVFICKQRSPQRVLARSGLRAGGGHGIFINRIDGDVRHAAAARRRRGGHRLARATAWPRGATECVGGTRPGHGQGEERTRMRVLARAQRATSPTGRYCNTDCSTPSGSASRPGLGMRGGKSGELNKGDVSTLTLTARRIGCVLAYVC